jgi:hypothetical protein
MNESVIKQALGWALGQVSSGVTVLSACERAAKRFTALDIGDGPGGEVILVVKQLRGMIAPEARRRGYIR